MIVRVQNVELFKYGMKKSSCLSLSVYIKYGEQCTLRDFIEVIMKKIGELIRFRGVCKRIP